MPNYSVLAAQMAAMFEIEGKIQKTSGAETLTIPRMSLNIGERGFHLGAPITINPLVDNDGSFSAWTFGSDYYIYAVHPAPDSIAPKILVSRNSTVPNGYTASNSRKIGGFHYGKIRRSTVVSDVVDGIVPNSVWDLRHRPICSPEGMVLVGGRVWVDIYLASDDGAGGLASRYNATPLTGTEGLNWYSFVERAAKVGKRLLTLAEWIAAAQGSPQGNDADNVNAWTATANTGRAPTGTVAYATSLANCRDCVGNVWEWLDEMVVRWDDTGAAGQAWGWKDVMPGQGYGQLYMYDEWALVAVLAGGSWTDGVRAGARSVGLHIWPWNVHAHIGARAACDPLSF